MLVWVGCGCLQYTETLLWYSLHGFHATELDEDGVRSPGTARCNSRARDGGPHLTGDALVDDQLTPRTAYSDGRGDDGRPSKPKTRCEPTSSSTTSIRPLLRKMSADIGPTTVSNAHLSFSSATTTSAPLEGLDDGVARVRWNEH